jgi:transcriptional regulator of acetoin/glycerol metabolism
LILSDGGIIAAAHLGLVVPPPSATIPSGPAAAESPSVMWPLAEVERRSILAALQRAKGNKSRAAATLGLSRGALYRRLRQFDLTLDWLSGSDPPSVER